ncbi:MULTISPECIES: hypothetical protein [Moorena]|nr:MULTISPECIES: hypothetical protein [Moorena]NEO19525.1 hypothetical protein [Moorena sp. SIO4A5]NEO42856.1 hypothetical protein [Moorena sp. SIO4A3]
MVSGQPLAFACSRSVGVAHKLKVSIQRVAYQLSANGQGQRPRYANGHAT